MNRSVIVAVKTEFEPFFLEDKRHEIVLLEPKSKRDIFLPTSKIPGTGPQARQMQARNEP